MPTWTASDYWDGWVADCGPYIGPWPPAPPIPANLPDSTLAAELDYYFSTSSLADVVAGTGINFTYDLGREWSGTDTVQFGTGIGLAPLAGTPHLFVVWFPAGFAWPAAAPTVDALTVAPSLYVSGGLATVPNPATGHWSGWLAFPPSFESSPPFAVDQEQRAWAAAEILTGLGNIEPTEGTVLTDLRAFSLGSAPTPHGFASFAVRAFKGEDAGTNSLVDTDLAELSLGTGTTARGLAQADVIPAAEFGLPDFHHLIGGETFPAGLVEGVDYTAPPAGTDDVLQVDYEGGATSAFDHWTTLDVDYHVQGATGTTGSSPFTANYSDVHFRFGMISGAPPATGWTGDGAGTDLDVITASLGSGVVSASTSLDVHLAPEAFYVNLQLAGYGGIGIPIPDWTWPGGVDGHGVGWALQIVSATLDGVLAYPRWRYWIPGGIAWHTAGGHWATPGGATMQILTPGVGWVDVVDGPA